jgi:hypothetical protein
MPIKDQTLHDADRSATFDRLRAHGSLRPARPEFASRRGWPTLALLCATQFMIVLDASIVIVALPSIQSALAFKPASLA